MGDLDAARRDFDRAIAMARDYDDRETESAAYANLGLFEAEFGEIETALGNAALGLAIAERAGNAIHIIASETAAAVALAGAGRFAEALARSESTLASIHQNEIGLYYEPVLFAAIARSKLALGEPAGALAAAEEAVDIANARGLTACALRAPIALAQVLIATRGATAGERIDSVLAGALRVAGAGGAHAFEPQIHRELAALARLRGDDDTAEREQVEASRIAAATRADEFR
jgi:tetratricopeptide (TPR) repeat protein